MLWCSPLPLADHTPMVAVQESCSNALQCLDSPWRHCGQVYAHPSQTECTLQQVPQLHPQRSVHGQEGQGPAEHPQQKGGRLEQVIKEAGGCIVWYAHLIPYFSPTLDVLV